MQATTAPGSSSGQFVDKTDLAPGTKWTATDANAWQAELLEVITESGLVPSGGDLTQLRQAIQLLAKLVKVDLATAADTAKTVETGEDAALPLALVQSGGGGYKALKVSDAGGTYNPETNTAAVNVSGNAATADYSDDAGALQGFGANDFLQSYSEFVAGDRIWRRLEVQNSVLSDSWVKKSETYTCEKSGTIRVRWYMFRNTAGTAVGAVRKNGVQFGMEQSMSNNTPSPFIQDVPVTAGDTIEVWGYYSGSYSAGLSGVSICASEDGPNKNLDVYWDNAEGFNTALEPGQSALEKEVAVADPLAYRYVRVTKTVSSYVKVVSAVNFS